MSDLTTYSLKQNKQESLLSECTISYHVSAFSHLGHHLISTKVLTHLRIVQDDELLHLLNVKGPRSSCWTAFPEHTKVTRFHHVIFHQQQAILYLTFFLVPQKHWKSVKIWTENSSWSHLMGVSRLYMISCVSCRADVVFFSLQWEDGSKDLWSIYFLLHWLYWNVIQVVDRPVNFSLPMKESQ